MCVCVCVFLPLLSASCGAEDRRWKVGVEEDEATFLQRRPRTCILTASRPEGVHVADQVFLVQCQNIIELKKEEVDQLAEVLLE